MLNIAVIFTSGNWFIQSLLGIDTEGIRQGYGLSNYRDNIFWTVVIISVRTTFGRVLHRLLLLYVTLVIRIFKLINTQIDCSKRFTFFPTVKTILTSYSDQPYDANVIGLIKTAIFFVLL